MKATSNPIVAAVKNGVGALWLSPRALPHSVGNAVLDLYFSYYKRTHAASREEIERIIREFRPDIGESELEKAVAAARDAWKRYGISPEEYYIYDFDSLSDEQRGEYISETDRIKYALAMNDWDHWRLLMDKRATCRAFEPFFRREVIRAGDIDDGFLARHPSFMYKPNSSGQGDGVARLRSLDELRAISGWEDGVCEELVRQDPRMAALHENSVNTVRVITVRTAEGMRIWDCVLRTGRGDSVVDNAAAGGIIALVDPETGVVLTDAIDERNGRWERHPDSGVVFRGFRIPLWDELRRLVDGMTSVFPGLGLVGWDLALAEDGWLMIEGNGSSQMLPQMIDKKPRKSAFLRMVRPSAQSQTKQKQE